MKEESNLDQETTTDLIRANRDIENSFNAPSPTNRSERRKKLKWLKQQLKQHVKRKPLKQLSHSPDTDLSTEDMQKKVAIMRAWATRYGILVRKINELENHGS